MKLKFQSSNGNERVIAEVNDVNEALHEINKFLDEHNFKSYYTRTWHENNRVIMDVGSWSEFFILEPCTMEQMHKEQEDDEQRLIERQL